MIAQMEIQYISKGMFTRVYVCINWWITQSSAQKTQKVYGRISEIILIPFLFEHIY
jgi:uncharacterized protein YggT (Ycf19 family)